MGIFIYIPKPDNGEKSPSFIDIELIRKLKKQTDIWTGNFIKEEKRQLFRSMILPALQMIVMINSPKNILNN